MSARTRLLGCVLACVLGVAGCGAAKVSGASPYDTSEGRSVTLVVNSWTGSQANVAVAGYLLRHELGYDVEEIQIDEVPAWQALSSGRADALLENWGHDDLKKTYISGQQTVVSGGELGVQGHIGWYVPTYLANKHPELKSWKGLRKQKELFRTPESGSKGQFLGGSPSYVTNDPALIDNLGLDLSVVYAGSEAAEIAQIKQAYAKKDPLLFYFYRPQWLEARHDFTEVKLPPYEPGCEAKPEEIRCAYPTYDLDKILSADFAAHGGKAARFLKAFEWDTKDQNQVALDIAQNKMSGQAAAKKWVEAHPKTWKPWVKPLLR